MASNRKVIIANNHWYHIYNRGVERRIVFTNKREYKRFIQTLRYYQYARPPIRYSKFLHLAEAQRSDMLRDLYAQPKIIEITSFCLMPNHFHLLLKQLSSRGISKYLANICNSYSKYFNIKHKRVGPLFQGNFKAVLIETDYQLLHVSRYIHLNHVSSLIIPEEKLDAYPWSSFPEHISTSPNAISTPAVIRSLIPSPKKYWAFVHDQIDYAKSLEKTKHLHIEEQVRS